MNRALLLLLATALCGCEYLGTDVATRIRLSLVEAKAQMDRAGQDSLTIMVKPNHWPDGCPEPAGYRVTLSPYKGNKQVSVGDINIQCQGKRTYYTGFGSEEIFVTRDITVEKKPADALRITLRRSKAGMEVVGLE